MACAHKRKGVSVEEAVKADLADMETNHKQEFERLKQSPCYMNPERKTVPPPPPPPPPYYRPSRVTNPLAAPRLPSLAAQRPWQYTPHQHFENLQGVLGQGQRRLPTRAPGRC